MFKNQRLDEILHILQDCQYITIPDLAKRLFVSQATVRRDLAILEKNNLIIKSYGGVSLNSGNNRYVKLDLRQIAHEKEKQYIAQVAASRVRSGDTLFLDGSSTVLSMVPFLRQKNLTVVTNSLRIADRMSQSEARIYVTGGLLLEGSKVFVGSAAERSLRDFHMDKLFFSAAGVSAEGDISDYSEPEAQLRQLMIQRSCQRYLLCDSSKFEKRYLFHIDHIEHLTAVLSDREFRFQNGTCTLTTPEVE